MILHKKKCIPCSGDTPPFSKSKINSYLKKLRSWKVYKNEKKAFYLSKNYKFKNFLQSLEFVKKTSVIAETEGHHPDISFGWGYAKILIYTHAINGLSESDFILASKIDRISV
jgi:4a-hydroxytetrahydrobiopterin dehydratase